LNATPFPPSESLHPPSPVALWLFERYLRREARRHFSAVHWTRATHEGPGSSPPTILVANHTNWWDGFLAFLVTRALRLEFRILMEAQHLARYRAFLRLGALPLDRRRARASYADLEAAASHLRPGVGLWIFPQGSRRPPAEPVTGCERGAAHLILRHKGPVRLCPVAFRYTFFGEQLPEAFALVGDTWTPETAGLDRASLMTDIERRLGKTVSALDVLLEGERIDAFQPLVPGRLSVNKRLDRVRHAVGLLRGPFESRNG
jgi:1-acyl-sn-glycerol-3-phosphate acyltransferase